MVQLPKQTVFAAILSLRVFGAFGAGGPCGGRAMRLANGEAFG